MGALKPDPQDAVEVAPHQVPGDVRRAAENPLIVLVEDQPDNQSLVQEYLEWKGYRVSVASSGEECLELVRRGPPSLILMDMRMPGLDGYQTTRLLRRMPDFGAVPIVALTANGLKKDAARCLEAGCTAYLAKPFEPEALLAIVERYLGPAG